MLGPTNKREPKEQTLLPLSQCLAKTVSMEDGPRAGVDVETHCLIVGYVARALVDRMPKWLKEGLFPQGVELIAAAHDVGKISSAFQEKIHLAAGDPRGLADPELDKKIGRHQAVSQATLDHRLKYIPEIIGRHHGAPPDQLVTSPSSENYGGPQWQQLRVELIEHLKHELQTEWPIILSRLNADVIAGLTTVADWIGSGSLFDTAGMQNWRTKIDEALDLAGFVVPQIKQGLSFKDVFGFIPHHAQTLLIESAQMTGAYVLEAPMGIGKTEAALYVAYRVLAKGLATGIYFALPTQLTSDKIYDRMNTYLQKILPESDSHRLALLLHGSAWLRDKELGADGAPGQSWFNSTKRGLLAPFAVGTVDQALMAVMNVKHGFVRTFGLAGKVVILDEVHSYDSYTGTILKELVQALRALHCTVIILSATLTDQQRRAILQMENGPSTSEKKMPYPLITAVDAQGNCQEVAAEHRDERKVIIGVLHDDRLAVEEALNRAQRGEQVLWIENTVAEAQDRFCSLAVWAGQCGIPCGLLHSRFTRKDREKNENEWVRLFGKAGSALRQQTGRILIGTQVLEQSLDIDADFLVTRLCPTDMLFQRLGRLWRHRQNDANRPPDATCEAWILAPALSEAIADSNVLGKTAIVYSPYVLCRTLEVWQSVTAVSLPRHIRSMLEATYLDRHETDRLARYKADLEKKRDKLSGMALLSVSRGGMTFPEAKASTRYSEQPTVDVLLVKKLRRMERGMSVRLMDGTEVSIPRYANAATRREVAVQLLNHTLAVPEYLAPASPVKNLSWLKDYVYIGDETESPFRVAIVEDSDALRGVDQSEASVTYALQYDDRLGYRAIKNGKEERDDESF